MGHHYTPQAYLRGFADPSDQRMIWFYDKKERLFRRASIKNVAQQPGFYTPEIEEQLNVIVEGPANRVIADLRDGKEIGPQERFHLSLYIATMLKRVPRHRQKFLDLAPKALEDTVRELKQYIEAVGKQGGVDPDLIARRLAEADAAERKFATEIPPEVIEKGRIPWPSEDLVALIFSMNWRFLWSAGPSFFVTSDNPGFFFEGLGLGRPESELRFPIAPTLALVGNWQGGWRSRAGDRIEPPCQRIVREINRCIVSAATRFVFCHEKAEWVANVASSVEPKLNRINFMR
jgi:hypothetical protein